MFAYVALLVVLTQTAHATNPIFANRTTANVQTLYTFTEGGGTIAYDQAQGPYTFGDLILDPVLASFSTNGPGITLDKGPFVTNPNTVAALISTRNTTKFFRNSDFASSQASFEIWVQPSNALMTVIAALGPLGDYPPIASECKGAYIAQYYTTLEMLHDGTHDGPLKGCTALIMDMPPVSYLNPAPIQFVYTNFAGSELYYFAQSNLTARNGGYALHTLDDPTYITYTNFTIGPQYPLQISNQGNVWQGKILLVAAYNRALSASEVAQNYNAWLPNTPPVATNLALNALQNTPLTVRPSSTDFDIMYGPPAVVASQTPLYRIVRQPTLGTITPNATLSASFVYTPFNETFGNYADSFTYQAYDGYDYSHNNATATVNILHVIHPAQVTNQTQIVMASVPTIISFVGTNPDTPSNHISNATILSGPSTGTLCTTTDGAVCLVNITSFPYTAVFSTNSLPIILYLTPAPLLNQSGRASLYTTSISYLVGNSEGGVSATAGVFSFSVLNFLQPTSTTIGAYEGVATNVTLFGTDARLGNISYYVASAPANGGILYLPGGNQSAPLTPGTLVPKGVVTYKSVIGAFGPAYDSFSFYTISSTLSNFRSPNATITVDVYYQAYPAALSLASGYNSVNITEKTPTNVPVTLTSPDPASNIFTCTLDTSTGAPGKLSIGNVLACNQAIFQTGTCLNSPSIRFSASKSVMITALNSLQLTYADASAGQGQVIVSVDNNDPYGRDFVTTFHFNVTVAAATQGSTSSSISIPTPSFFSGVSDILVWALWITGAAIVLLCCCCHTCLTKTARRTWELIGRCSGYTANVATGGKVSYTSVP